MIRFRVRIRKMLRVGLGTLYQDSREGWAGIFPTDSKPQ